jgi:hypothetical protein
VSFGRQANSAGEESFPAQTAVTLGLPNSGPRIGPVVINEIHYHPAPGGDEFVELLNITLTNVPLFSVPFPTNTWRMSGLGFTFPTHLVLDAGEMLLLVATNPASFAKYACRQISKFSVRSGWVAGQRRAAGASGARHAQHQR